MKASFKIVGHLLLKMDISDRRLARCSCGASANVLAMPTGAAHAKARRNWHDEHKRNVLRRLHPEDFKEDQPIIDDPDAFRY
jgi:hypothetical protein